jgi:hypothetical protein
MSLFMSICRPHFPNATIVDNHTAPLVYPPEDESAGFRQRSMKTHSGAVGAGGQPDAQDDTRDASTSAPIRTATGVLIAHVSQARLTGPPHADVRLAVLTTRLPVVRVPCRQGVVPDDRHVLRVLLLRRLGEMKTSSLDDLPIDDDDRIISNGTLGIDRGRHPLVGQEAGRGVLLAASALVENDLDPHATSVRVEQRPGDGGGREAVGLGGHAGLGVTNGVDHQAGTVPARGEAHGGRRGCGGCTGRRGRWR